MYVQRWMIDGDLVSVSTLPESIHDFCCYEAGMMLVLEP
jgi:hypothetical protein